MTPKCCAYLTMQDPGDFVMDYELGIAPMQARGWQVDTVAWRDPAVDWDRYAAVYICTPWDYPEHLQEFLATLERIDRSAAILVNPIELVRWALDKTYLADVEARGGAIVPSLWDHDFDPAAIPGWFETFAVDRLVIKPVVGANTVDAFVLDGPPGPDLLTELRETYAARRFFVQPFVESVCDEGEYSLFYFNGAFSHAIRKVPKSGDFRVQEEHGASIEAIKAEPALRAAGRSVLATVQPLPMYARVDLVRGSDDRFLLMELELVEPSLYLRMDTQAPARFASAFDAYLEGVSV